MSHISVCSAPVAGQKSQISSSVMTRAVEDFGQWLPLKSSYRAEVEGAQSGITQA